MKRSPLRNTSAKQKARLERYHAMLQSWPGKRVCSKCGHTVGLEPHHPWGRGRENLFRVVLLCHACHEGCHAQPDQAYAFGWLQPEYRGVIHPPDFPTPWKPEQLITDIP